MRQNLKEREAPQKAANFAIFGDPPYDMTPDEAASQAVARIVADVMKPRRRRLKLTVSA